MKLELAEVTKTYGVQNALDGISVEIDDVHTLVLIGPSGGGKSTLLRILGGLETPTRGSVRVNGETLATAEPELLSYRRQNGFLFQAFNLFPHLTAMENITLPLEKVHRRTSAEATAAAESALERFGLAEHRHKLPAQLSGGQQQRVGIARAVAMKPKLLLLDEPTSALDPEMTAEVLDLIKELAEGGQDIILSTHEMGFAKAVGDRVVFLADGQIVEQGTGREVFEDTSSDAAKRFLSRVMRW